jgi:hypothetical protein
MKKRKEWVLPILGFNYKVEKIDGLAKPDKDNPDMTLSGWCNTMRLSIQIDGSLSNVVFAATVLHEAIEVINVHLDLGLTHAQVCAIETGLHPIVKVKLQSV